MLAAKLCAQSALDPQFLRLLPIERSASPIILLALPFETADSVADSWQALTPSGCWYFQMLISFKHDFQELFLDDLDAAGSGP